MFLNGNQKVVVLKTLFKYGGNQQLGLLVTHDVFMQRTPPSGPYLTLHIGINSVMEILLSSAM